MNKVKNLLSAIPHKHITDKIELMWGTNDCDVYINSLLLADRARSGFDPNTYSVLFTLLTENELEIRSKLNVKNIDQVSGNDWAKSTGKWVIVKRPEKK